MVKILRGPRVYYAAGIRTECENCCGKGKFEGRACFYCGGSKKIPQFCPICGEPAVQIEHRGPEVGKGWYVYLCEEHRTKVFEPTKPESTGIINDLFTQKLDSSEGKEKISEYAGTYIRDRLRMVSFARKIEPPKQCTPADQPRSVNPDTLVKIVYVEPQSRASSTTYRSTKERILNDLFKS